VFRISNLVDCGEGNETHKNSRLEGQQRRREMRRQMKQLGKFRLYIASYHVHHFSMSKLIGVRTFWSSQNSSLWQFWTPQISCGQIPC